MASKKELIRKGKLSKPRCYIGYFGLTPEALHRFATAFKGTIYRPDASDVVKVKIQPTFHGDVNRLIQDLCASNDSQFLASAGNCLIFYKARPHEVGSGSDRN